MRLLVIGGTRFLGRHLAALALERGHALTLMHRGLSAPHLFPEAEHRIADRNADLACLQSRETWDAAIDTSGYFPRQIERLAARLAGRVGQYQFISSISVYDDAPRERTDERAALRTLADPGTEVLDAESYGGLKALCERAAQRAFGNRCLVARPGLIVGPFDPSGRFTWWADRLARGGEVLAPGDPQAPVQFIDARDAAAWLLLQAEHGRTGVFNLTGPAVPIDFAAMLDSGRAALAPHAHFTWVDEAFLLAQGVTPWTELPVWLPRADARLHRTDIARAVEAGLLTRPLQQTFADTAAWAAHAAPVALKTGIGLGAQRERALLAAWKSAHG